MRMSPKELYKAGIAAFNKKQYDEAIQHFNQLVLVKPDNEAHFLLGNTYMAKKDNEKAFHYFEMATKDKSTKNETYFNKHKNYKADSLFCMAKITNHLNDSNKAMNFILNAILIDKNNPHYHALKAEFCFNQKQFEEAVDSYEESIQICKTALGTMQQNPKKMAAVLQKYEPLLIRYYKKLLNTLMQCKPSQKYFDMIVRCYTSLAFGQPEKEADYRIKMARWFAETNQLDSAINIWDAIFKKKDTAKLRYEASLVIHKKIAQIEKGEKVPEYPIYSFEKSQEQNDPRHNDIPKLYALEEYHLQAASSLENKTTEDTDENLRCYLAKEFYRMVISINKNNPSREERLKAYGDYLKHYPDHKDGLYYLGTLYFRDGARTDAIVQFLKVLKIDPKHTPTIHILFDTLLALDLKDDLHPVNRDALYKVIKTYPQEQKLWLAEQILRVTTPLGLHLLYGAGKAMVEELIYMLPAGRKRNAFIAKACKQPKDSETPNQLFLIMHRSSFFGEYNASASTSERMDKDYREYSRYQQFVHHSAHKNASNLSKLYYMKENLVQQFDPKMLGQILKQFYSAAEKQFDPYGLLDKLEPDISTSFEALINLYSFDQILEAIQAPAIPGALKGNSLVTKAYLLEQCLTEETLLGTKFLVDGNKRTLQKVVNALPEETVPDIEKKLDFLERMIEGKGTEKGKLHIICWQPTYSFGTVVKESGTMKELCDDKLRLQQKIVALRCHHVPGAELLHYSQKPQLPQRRPKAEIPGKSGHQVNNPSVITNSIFQPEKPIDTSESSASSTYSSSSSSSD